VVAILIACVVAAVGAVLGWAVYTVQVRTGWILYHTALVEEPDLVSTLVYYATVSTFTWHASPSFPVTTWLLWRKLPRQLLPFLQDVYNRGVLRRAGAVYEFRHALLQKYLADPEC
jgi:hypothetical protein